MMGIKLILMMDVIIHEILRIGGAVEMIYCRKVYDSRCVEMGLMTMLMNSEMMVIMNQEMDVVTSVFWKILGSESIRIMIQLINDTCNQLLQFLKYLAKICSQLNSHRKWCNSIQLRILILNIG